MMIKIKEFLVTSPLGGPLRKISSETKRRLKTIRHPELDQFYRDDDYLDKVLVSLIKPTSNCIDIGCHIGSVLKVFLDHAPQGHHIAVEPTPAKAASLRTRFPGVTIHECALADTPGEAVFYEDTKRSGYSSLVERNADAPEIRAYTVKVRTLDEIAAASPNIDIIKIDVEGAELRVLEGGGKTITKHKPVIIFECGPTGDAIDGVYFGDDLHHHLTKVLDYKIYAAMDIVFNRPPLSLAEFRRYRTYPFVALNFIAKPDVASV